MNSFSPREIELNQLRRACLWLGLLLLIYAPVSAQQSTTAPPAPTKTDWKEFTPAIGGFTVAFPQPPQERALRYNLPEAYAYRFDYVATVAATIYRITVLFNTESKATPENTRQQFTELLKQLKSHPSYIWLNGGEKVLDGNPGIEYQVETKDAPAALITSRQFFAFGKVYEISVQHPKEANDTSRTLRFLDSFKIRFSPFDPATLPAELFEPDAATQNFLVPGVEQVTGKVLIEHATQKVMPKAAKTSVPAGPQSKVQIHLVVSEEGQVLSAQAINGDPGLAEASVEAIRQWTFRPILINDKPTKVQGILTFNFNPR